jgi:hypothetical protein
MAQEDWMDKGGRGSKRVRKRKGEKEMMMQQ